MTVEYKQSSMKRDNPILNWGVPFVFVLQIYQIEREYHVKQRNDEN